MATSVVAEVNTPSEVFTVHDQPVWRDRANFIVNAPLTELGRFEQLWCRQDAEDEFEVCCIPFFLYDVALGDTIQTRAANDRKYVMSRVVSRSGRFVFRVHFERSMLRNRDDVTQKLAEMGALQEWSSASLAAVDAEDAHHAQELADYLFRQEQAGRLVYETGNSA